MPTWWGKKLSKSKSKEQEQLHGGAGATSKKGRHSKPSKSFDDELMKNSPRASPDAGGHPLPRPSVSSIQSFTNDHAFVYGSASASGASSLSSTASYDDQPTSHPHFNPPRGQCDMKFTARPKSPGPGSIGPTSTTLPLHQILHVLTLDSPTDKLEVGKSESHPLPLPPGSPTSPSSISLSNTRANGMSKPTSGNLSKWKKGKLLGQGTFGHVYLGFNSDSGHLCAIKEVRVVCDDQTSKECFKQLSQEINLLSQLSHPNIVQYYGSNLGKGTLSVYLEYVSGGSIHKLLREYGAFKEPVIQNYTRKIVSGLCYLHGRNTVHRDIKGANILVDPNGEIKLADFGMAKHINASNSMLSFKGSPYWMAPEVVMNTNGYSLPVDIWSLGCTILEMATSKPPWSQHEGVAAIFKIGNSKDLPEIPDHLSSEAKNFIQQCLQRDPSARPTAHKLLEHPFIRESATKATNVRLTRDVFPYTFDGSRTPPPVLDHSNRTSITSLDGDYATKPIPETSRSVKSPRDNTRMITSLPVSPSSSPLRQYGPALSPPHPSYTLIGQNTLPSYPVRSNATFTLDPFHETSFYKAYTPGGSPRRLI